MAIPDTSKVSASKPTATGAIFVGDVGKNLPADSKTALNVAYVKLGYVGEDGIKNSVEVDSEDIKAFGGDTVLVVNTGRKETFEFALIQSLDPDVLKEVYGKDNVTTGSDVTTIKHNAKELPERTWIFEVLLTGGLKKRIVVPKGKITEVGEVVYKDGELIAFECTLTAFPDAEGNTAIEYIGAVA